MLLMRVDAEFLGFGSAAAAGDFLLYSHVEEVNDSSAAQKIDSRSLCVPLTALFFYVVLRLQAYILTIGPCICIFKRLIYSYPCISSNLLMQGRLYHVLRPRIYIACALNVYIACPFSAYYVVRPRHKHYVLSRQEHEDGVFGIVSRY
jgi:hypothetical protein